jgi:hypothetical protein
MPDFDPAGTLAAARSVPEKARSVRGWCRKTPVRVAKKPVWCVKKPVLSSFEPVFRPFRAAVEEKCVLNQYYRRLPPESITGSTTG